MYPAFCGGFFTANLAEDELLRSFPNPSTSELTVESTNEIEEIEIYNIKLYDNFGTLVKSIGTSDKSVNFSTSDLPDGIYVLKVVHSKGILTRRVIIKK